MDRDDGNVQRENVARSEAPPLGPGPTTSGGAGSYGVSLVSVHVLSLPATSMGLAFLVLVMLTIRCHRSLEAAFLQTTALKVPAA